ncbi:unnamed protein product [Cylicostephanus goldi]|uniref:Uncharacterized protein n=1 Tax=Cylicostephanus goldi TaxID=71465 RepID=A0A3P6SEH0_CYLGO|nr:unnamed protein product [Cylicostephanus goldi]
MIVWQQIRTWYALLLRIRVILLSSHLALENGNRTSSSLNCHQNEFI